MQAIIAVKINIMLCMIFLVLVLGGLLVQHIVKKMRWEIILAEYEMERGPIEEAPKPPPPEQRLPGYTLLTYTDYEEMKEALKKEMAEGRFPDLSKPIEK